VGIHNVNQEGLQPNIPVVSTDRSQLGGRLRALAGLPRGGGMQAKERERRRVG
jgi:hypothetical protein